MKLERIEIQLSLTEDDFRKFAEIAKILFPLPHWPQLSEQDKVVLYCFLRELIKEYPNERLIHCEFLTGIKAIVAVGEAIGDTIPARYMWYRTEYYHQFVPHQPEEE